MITWIKRDIYLLVAKVGFDYIRTRANEANHEIQLMNAEDAQALITFVEMLLKFIYQFPNMVPQASGVKSPDLR